MENTMRIGIMAILISLNIFFMPIKLLDKAENH